jgi:hypothetical protein
MGVPERGDRIAGRHGETEMLSREKLETILNSNSGSLRFPRGAAEAKARATMKARPFL